MTSIRGSIAILAMSLWCLVAADVATTAPELDPEVTGYLSLQVDHSLDGGQSFSHRGVLSVNSLLSGSGSLDPSTLNSNEKSDLSELCAADGLYLLRAVGNDGTVHRAAVHACNLIGSSLKDVLTVNVDWRNKVVGVSISSDSSQGQAEVSDEAVGGGLSSRVVLQRMEVGPQPDTVAFIQRFEQEKLAKERGETKDNRSFFSKYWMFLLPLILFLTMNGSGGGGGGGGGGR